MRRSFLFALFSATALAACAPPQAPAAAPCAPPTPVLSEKDVELLADAIKHIEPAHLHESSPPTARLETTLQTGSLKVFPSSGAPVDLQAPLYLSYSSVSEILTVIVMAKGTKASSKAPASLELRFYRPIRWEERPGPGDFIIPAD